MSLLTAPAAAATVVFNDGTYCVIVYKHTVAIGKQDAGTIHVPRGHAYFDRVAEATERRLAEDLYTELAAAIA